MRRELEAIAESELNETAESREKCLKLFREWIQANDDLFTNIRLDANFLLRFLRAKKFNLECAKIMLIKYLVMRQTLPRFFEDLDFLDETVQEIIRGGFLFPSPIRDRQHRRVLFGITRNFDARKYSKYDISKVYNLTYEALIMEEETQIAGLCQVGDFSGFNMYHAILFGPIDFNRVMKAFDKSFPLRQKGLHSLNMNPLIRWIVDVTKSVINAKLRERFYIHSSQQGLLAHFDAEVLPIEFGGTRFTSAQMIEIWLQDLSQRKDKILQLDLMRANVDKCKAKIAAEDKIYRVKRPSLSEIEVD